MADQQPGTVIGQIVVTAEAEVIKAADLEQTEPVKDAPEEAES